MMDISVRHLHLLVGKTLSVARKRSRRIISRESTDGQRQTRRSLLGANKFHTKVQFSGLVLSCNGITKNIHDTRALWSQVNALLKLPPSVDTKLSSAKTSPVTSWLRWTVFVLPQLKHRFQISSPEQHQVCLTSPW